MTNCSGVTWQQDMARCVDRGRSGYVYVSMLAARKEDGEKLGKDSVHRVVRPLAAAAGSLFPAGPWLSPSVAPGKTTATAAPPAMRFATRRAMPSDSASSRRRRLSSSRLPKDTTVAVDDTDSDDSDDDSEETTTSEDESSDDDSDDAEKTTSYGGSNLQRTIGWGRPPKETVAIDGCDFEHWLVVMEGPPGDRSNPDVSRDEIIDSDEKARKKIYSVSTRHYFAFGARISEELSHKLRELPKVLCVLPDSYLDVHNKEYVGEPFINGKAVPYDPKYHEEWVRNNTRVDQRPPNFDRSSVRRDNMENIQNRDVTTDERPRPKSMSPSQPCQQTIEPHYVPPVHHTEDNMPPSPPSPNNGDPPTYQHHVPSPQARADTLSFVQICQQCGAPVHQVGNQDLQDSPDARMRDDNDQVCQRGRSHYQNGSATGQTTLHGANAPPCQSGSAPASYQAQEGHHHHYCNCNVHHHYYY
nr:unnamed protein product [Digitaria exilis]